MTATTTETSTAADGRPIARIMPALPVNMFAGDARTYIDGIMADLETAEDRARTAGSLADSFDESAETARVRRDAAIHTLTVHYKLPHGSMIHAAAGMPRTTLAAIRNRMAKIDPPRVDDAEEAMVTAARQTLYRTECAKVAREYRNAAVRELVADGWSNSKIGVLIKRDQSRVVHIKNVPA